MQRFYFTQQPKGVVLWKGVKETSFDPDQGSNCTSLSQISCPKKSSQSEHLGSSFCHLYCTLSHKLGQYTSYSQPFLLTPHDAGITPNLLSPNPGFIEIKKKKINEKKKMFLDSSADIATGRTWLVQVGIIHMTSQTETLLFHSTPCHPRLSIVAISASAPGWKYLNNKCGLVQVLADAGKTYTTAVQPARV